MISKNALGVISFVEEQTSNIKDSEIWISDHKCVSCALQNIFCMKELETVIHNS